MPQSPARPATLSALLARTAALHPADAAVTDAAGTLDWAGLAARAGAYAGLLRAQGIGRGDRVALWLPNCADYLALIFACARLGAVAVHINTRFRSAELGPILRRSQARLLVTAWDFPPVDFAAILSETAAEGLGKLDTIVGRAAGVRCCAGLPVVPLQGMDAVGDVATPEDACLTYTTSGTTSGPKLVLHDQLSIAGHASDVMHAIGTDAPDAALLAVTPFCGTFGNAAAMAAVAGGAHVVCMERFDAAAADALIRRHRITHSVGGDDMLARLVAAARGVPHTTMRFFGYAAFQPDAVAAVAAADAAGLMPRGVYGSSEVQALFAIQPDERRTAPGGDPVSDRARMAVRDPETGAPAEAGELCIAAPSLFRGYLDDDAATRRAHTPNGLFRTGDLARAAGRGFAFLARLGDTLRLGGFLVNPEEIEGFLHTLPGIAAAQVVGATRGTTPCCIAFVRAVSSQALDEAALLAACGAGLARHKVPARIVVVDEFPTVDSPNGRKIQRAALRRMAEGVLREAVPMTRE